MAVRERSIVAVKRFLCNAFVATLMLATAPALGDVPHPRRECVVDGLGCERCMELYNGEPDQNEEFATCKQAAEGRGLVEACRGDRQGIAVPVFFCPKDAHPETKVVGGGCAGCTAGSSGRDVACVIAALGALAILAMRRRSRA